MTTMYSILGLCLLIIILVLARLVHLNQSDKTWGTLISIALVGVATIITAIFAGLKETKSRISFPTYLLINPFSYEPVFQLGEDKISKRMGFLAFYVNGTSMFVNPILPFVSENVYSINLPRPSTPNNWLIYNQECLTYDILKTIQHACLSSTTYIYGNKATVQVKTTKYPSDIQPYNIKPGDVNFFQFKYFEIDKSLFDTIQLPEGTTVTAFTYEDGLNAPALVSVIEIKKENFFKIDFEVRPISKPSNLLPLSVKKDETKQHGSLGSFVLSIDINSVFEKISSANYKTSQYIEWSNSLIEEVKSKYDDSQIQ